MTEADSRRRAAVLKDWARPLILLTALTVLASVLDLDLFLARCLFRPGEGWHLAGQNLWMFLYDHGNVPGLLLGLAGFLAFLLSFHPRRKGVWRKEGLFLFLLLALGPGLVVNALFKDHWGRPRPCEIREFGGPAKYLPPWEKGVAGQGKSFPSGHAAVGFYVGAPFFLLRRSRPGGAAVFLAAGLAYGGLMGAGRMVQGAHFLSDVLWAWGMVHLTGLALWYLLRLNRDRPD